MGKTATGIYRDTESSRQGLWQVDKQVYGERIRQRGFLSFEGAETWLTKEVAERHKHKLLGQRPTRTFNQAAARYIQENEKKLSLETDAYLLRLVMPYLGELDPSDIDQEEIDEFVSDRLLDAENIAVNGAPDINRLAAKTINLAIGAVQVILNQAATSWKHDKKLYWLERAPQLKRLDLTGRQRPPSPISWKEQENLLEKLPPHLKRMALFAINTGVRDSVTCNLRWSWEIQLPQFPGRSLFYVPKEYVKGRKRDEVIVCNSVAQAVIDECRGMDKEFVFVYRRERIKNFDKPAKMPYRPIQTMNNNGWQTAREAAGLSGLHVHDLRHTFATRLRAMAVPEETIRVLLWHAKRSMTAHYSMAQVQELADAVERIIKESNTANLTLDMAIKEYRAQQACKSG